MERYTFMGEGDLYLRPFAGGRLRRVGNCPQMQVEITEEVKELESFRPGGGLYNSVRRVKKAMLKLTLDDWTQENMALALYGDAQSVPSGSVTDESHTAWLDGVVRLAQAPSAITTVTNATGDVTYVEGTDYEIEAGGLLIPEDSTIPDGSEILVDYSHGAADVLEALTNSGQEMTIYLSGKNLAEGSAVNLVDVYRVRFGPTKNLALLGPDYAKIELEGDMIKDDSKTGAGISQFMRIQRPAA
jgi:hypothetical protein